MNPGKSLWLSLAVLAALPLVLFAPALFGGKMLWGADIETLEFAFKTAARRSLAAGEWPLWMPELLGGMPGIAASNLVFLHPIELAITVLGLPAWAAFGLDSALEVFLSGCGMLLFLRRQGLSPAACLLGALFFAFSGTQISILFAGHINNTKAIAMIPWCFWATHKAMTEKSWLAFGMLGAALALQILGIGMQIFAYTILGVATYAGWLAWTSGEGRAAWIRAAGGLALAVGLMALLSAPQLWLSLEYKPHSWREGFSYEAFTSWSFHPKEALGWLVPGFYGWREPTYRGDWAFCLSSEYFGLLPWVLAAAAVAARWRPSTGSGLGPVRFFAFLAIASFLIGIGKWTPIHHLFYRLPIYSGFRTWTRFLCLLTFAVSALAAVGWDELVSGARRGAALKGALGLCALALVAAFACLAAADGAASASAQALASKLGGLEAAKAALLGVMRPSAEKALALGLALAAGAWLLARSSMPALALLLALGLHAWDQGEVARRYLEFRNPAGITAMPQALSALPKPEASPEPWRLMELPGTWPQNRTVLWGYENLQGYHGVQLAGPLKIQNAMQSRQLDWAGMMNVRYIAGRERLQGLPLLVDGDLKIHANPRALPRAWLVARSRKAADEGAAFAALGDPSFDPAQEAVLLEEVKLPGGKAAGSVRWLKRSPNRFQLEVEAGQDSLLMISNTWYPAWKAELDGKPAPLLKANGALQAVALPQGRHSLKMHYSPALFYAALAAVLAGLSVLFGLWRREKGRYNWAVQALETK